MADRNKLFRKAHGMLMKEGASKEEAIKVVKEELRQGGRRGGPGGQGDRVPPVVLIDDICEGILS